MLTIKISFLKNANKIQDIDINNLESIEKDSLALLRMDKSTCEKFDKLENCLFEE